MASIESRGFMQKEIRYKAKQRVNEIKDKSLQC